MWTGPWRIIEFKTAIVVIVQHEKTHKKQTVGLHVDRLVPCHNINVSLNNDTRKNVEPVQPTSSSPVYTSSRIRKKPTRLELYVTD